MANFSIFRVLLCFVLNTTYAPIRASRATLRQCALAFSSWINPHHARTAEKICANRAALTVARERITRAG